MNQLIMDITARTMRSLGGQSLSIVLIHPLGTILHQQSLGSYSVVKFMVKVRLIEKRVKSQVGNVIVVKVMTQ
jgi:hypothetical protein